MTDRRVVLRIFTAALLMLPAFTGLGFRLAFLHLKPHEQMRERIDMHRRVKRRLLAGRGNIYDRRGSDDILALSLPVKDVCADPAEIIKKNILSEVTDLLSDTLDLPADEVAVKLNAPRKRFVRIKRFVPDEDLVRLRKRHMPGIFFRNQIVRRYPYDRLMCHVLGFVNDEGVGSAGIEQMANRFLRGCNGLVESRVDALRREIYWEDGRYVPPIRGADVTLTIDQNIQFTVERALDCLMEEHKPRGAWAIVERVATGEILAMASRPDYNPNRFRESTPEQRMNRAVSYVYEPGSTFKALTFSAVLNEHVVTAHTIIDCEHGRWSYAGKVLHDHHAYGKLTVADGLKKSSNILSAKIAIRLGRKRFYRYLKAFGIGSKTGIDLPGEEAGILCPLNRWSKVSITRIPIGQGVAVTALQMLGVLCTIANDGVMMRPYVVKQIKGADGVVLLDHEPIALRRVISRRTAAVMRELLMRVTEKGGTGTRAVVDGYEVAGKTGTAQKPVRGGYSRRDFMASFVGFIPARKPEIAIIVVADTPHGRFHTGGRVAGPVFSMIADDAVRYLDIPPVSDEKLASR